MRTLMIFLAAAALAVPGAAHADGPQSFRDAREAFRGVRQGDILPLDVIRSRIRIPGAEFIGADLIAGGTVYRLRFMRGANVMWVDVDARTGQVRGRAGF
jgi:hypothetical protein